jgi:hypothetical protein
MVWYPSESGKRRGAESYFPVKSCTWLPGQLKNLRQAQTTQGRIQVLFFVFLLPGNSDGIGCKFIYEEELPNI